MYGMLIHICMRLCSLVDIIQTDNNAYVVTPRARMLLCRAERCKQAVLHDKQTVKHLKQMARRYLIEEVNASNGNTGMRCANLLCNPCPFHSMLGLRVECYSNVYMKRYVTRAISGVCKHVFMLCKSKQLHL